MKQIMLSAIVALLVLGCGNPADDGSKGQEQIQEPPKTIDERLIGGTWYNSWLGELPDNLNVNYFEFFSDTNPNTFKSRMQNGGALPMGVYDAYTENNTVYDARTGKPLIWFEFYDPQMRWEYAEEQWVIVEPKAQSGDMIKWKYISTNGVPSSTNHFAFRFNDITY